MRNAILTLLLFGLLAAHANPAAFYGGLTAARLRGNAVVASDAWADAGLNAELISYWAMRTNTATTVFDEYGTFTATATNTTFASGTNGVRDAGATFTGTSSYLTCGNVTKIGTNDYTISAWVKTANTTAAFKAIAGRGYLALLSGVGIYMEQSHTPAFAIRTASVLIVASGPAAINTGSWVHLVGTVERGNTNGLKLYVNGNCVATNNPTALSGIDLDPGVNVPFSIAARFEPTGSGYTFFFPGSIDEVAVWNRALSSNEVFNLYSTPLFAPYKP
jgi:hypothetical protein